MPTLGTVAFDAIPHALKAIPQWVLWQREERDCKSTKVPYNAITGKPASVTKPNDWATFGRAMAGFNAGKFDGIGFVLTKDDPFTGVDLDHCVDPATGVVEPWALAIIYQLHSYTERSPSRAGLRIFLFGRLPPDRRRKGPIEFYDAGRYLTVTGDHLAGTPLTIENRHATLQLVHAEHFHKTNPNMKVDCSSQPITADDDTQLARAFRSRHGARIQALWNGEWHKYFPSQSEADASLCCSLAFWFGRDAARMDRVFRQSQLMREKWNSRRGDTTYGADCIANACAMVRATYQGNRHEGSRAVRKAIECCVSLHVEYL